MPDINDLKESADKLVKQARETADLGVQIAREQIHDLVKDPEMIHRMEEAEAAFDRQMDEITRRIEEGANQLYSVFSQILTQVPGTKKEAPEEATTKPRD